MSKQNKNNQEFRLIAKEWAIFIMHLKCLLRSNMRGFWYNHLCYTV